MSYLLTACLNSILVLEKNHFQFNKENYMQRMGTAMGSPMAPSYTSLFMGKLEQDFLESRDYAPSIWLRFFDGIFMVCDHYLESLHSFIDALNSVPSNYQIYIYYVIKRSQFSWCNCH